MRLLRVELARLRSRRAYWLLVVLALAGALLAVGASVNDARPPTAGEIAEAQRLVDQELNQPYIQEELERCEESQADGETELYPPDFDCNDILPRLEYYLYYEEPNFVDDLQELVPAVALMLALAGALVGATFVGAEWAAGTIGTHLLFEPRRGRVFAAKAGAVAIGLALPALVALGVVYLSTWLAASEWGSTELVSISYEFSDDFQTEVITAVSWLDLGLMGVRALLLVAGAAVGGYVLAMAFRSSLAAVGTVAAYGLVGEGLVRALWGGVPPWLLSSRVSAWLLLGGYDIVEYPESCNTGAGPCEPDIVTLSALDGGLYLGGLLAAGLLVSYVLFRRRDVT